ncbi:MAG: glutamate racemase [Rhabdochlamydiaceae bacterium]|nr:glutamate racemase [Rhabdochlamydiaceae bacterium]
MQSPQNKPIGVFDSGFGGLTVLKELQKTLPHEQFIYLGDTARLPYGTKSPEAIIQYTLESCSFLSSQGVKLIVIACNTATAIAMDVLTHFSIPIIGVIDPVIESIVQTSPHGRIGILATKGTVASGVYQKKIHHHLPTAKITAVAATLLVSLVEEGFIDHPITKLAIQEYIRPLLLAEIDTAILACTHFPLLKNQIEKALGPSIQVIDPAFDTSQAVKKKLFNLDLLSTEQKSVDPIFYVSDDPYKFTRLAQDFLEQPVSHVSLCQTPSFDSHIYTTHSPKL